MLTILAQRAGNLIGNVIEPPVPGIRVAEVLEVAGQPSGFVLDYIPPTHGRPVRSRKHSNFYMRVSAGTFPMEYFQLADMFGRRQRPVLSLWAALGRVRAEVNAAYWEREFFVGIMNSGRGIASFPAFATRLFPASILPHRGLPV
jgi:hypothetical protein